MHHVRCSILPDSHRVLTDHHPGALPMDLISLVVVLVVVGVLLWLVNNYIPMDTKIKQILNIVVVVAVVVWLLNVLGLMSSIRGVRVGR
jgi:hypothetical protein